MFKHAVQIVLAILLFTTSTNLAQGRHGEIGKFLKASDADILFGKVIQSFPINNKDLREAVSNAKDYILFSLKNNRLNITNEKRKKLTSTSYDVGEKEIMFFFSKSIVSALVSFAGNSQIFAEQRPNNVYSFTVKQKESANNSMEISNEILKTGAVMSTTSATADVTLEMSGLCPPICSD